MKWETFHHPDLSMPVIRRKASVELMTLLAGTAKMVLSGGSSEIYGHCYPNRRAFHASLSRLRKKGLVVQPQTDGSMPRLRLTPEGEGLLPIYYDPYRFWSKRWNKWWYILMFDVPEKDRPYRDTLRHFLKNQRFGCLQKSVWVTPWDVRPEYDDLDRAAAVDSVAFLFEAKTVLGHGNQSVVQEAWDFGRINSIQSCYIESANQNLLLLGDSGFSDSELMQLLRMENQAFAQALSIDPLLPEELHPKDYCGMRVFELHQEFLQRISEHLYSP